MKKCTYCGKTYSDDAVACAVDAQPLIPHVPRLPPHGPYTLPIEVRPIENWDTFLHLKQKPAGLRIAMEGLTCYPGGFPLLIKWNEIQRMEEHSESLGLSVKRAAIHIYRHDTRGQPVIVELLGLELDPPVIYSILQKCREVAGPNTFGQTKPRDMPSWDLPIEIRLSLDHAQTAIRLGVVILGASLLSCLVGGRVALVLASPAVLIAICCFGFGWYNHHDRKTKIRLTKEGIECHRGLHSWSLKWNEITRIYLYTVKRSRARLYFDTRAAKSRLSVNVFGLDRTPKKVFDLVQELQAAQTQSPKHISQPD